MTKPQNARILLRCFGFLRPYWRIVAGAYLAALGSSVLSAVVPQVIRRLVDDGIAAGHTGVLGWGVLSLLALTLLNGVLGYLVSG